MPSTPYAPPPAALTPTGGQPLTSSSSGTPTGQPGRAGTTATSAAQLNESFAALSRRVGGQVGLAYAPLGVASSTVSLGNLRSGAAWSTIKAPLAIAVTTAQNGKTDPGTSQLVASAITTSDNGAAEQLWGTLGPPATAAAATQNVLRSAGDAATVVQSRRVRPEFSSFGQTQWALGDQAMFAAALPCLKDSSRVLALMSQVDPGQQWGIGAAQPKAPLKGGWGPDQTGRYLVRQIGLLTLADGSRVGVAIAAAPADGTFRTGTANVSTVASWFLSTVREGGARRC